MKRITAVLMAILMVFTSTVTTFAASKTTKYTFNWGEYFTQEARTVPCYYSDSYFTKSSSKYNEHLASASMAMALTGTRSVKSENAIDALKKIGCKKIKSVTHIGSKAVVMGKKKIKNGTLVVVNTKATYGFCEWDNNVYFGLDGDVAGYVDISERTYKKILSYVKNDKNVKFWIFGHSRGGGIANLVAKDLSDKFGKKNVYAYCFDNPTTTTARPENEKYTNIHNVEIADSGASVLFPAYMGLGRYGTVDKVVTAEGGQDAEMLKMLRTISDCEYWSGNDFRWAKIDRNILHYLEAITGKPLMDVLNDNLIVGESAPQEDFWKELLDLMEKIAPTREAFVCEISKNAQAAAEKLGYETAYTGERAARSLAIHLYNIVQFKDIPGHEEDSLVTAGKNLLDSRKLISLVADIAPVIIGQTPKMMSCSKEYANWIKTLCKEMKLDTVMSEEEAQDTELMLATLVEPLLKLIKYDFRNDHQIIGTVLYNTHRLYDCHVPVTMMAYLMADDSYYNAK